MNPNDFYKKYNSAALVVQNALGINKNTILAWWSWETAFATNTGSKYNNLGGIKYTKNADFKVPKTQGSNIEYSGYNSTESYAKDFVRVLSVNGYGYPEVLKANGNDVAGVTRVFNASKYAEHDYNVDTIVSRAKAAALATGGTSSTGSTGTPQNKPEPTPNGGGGGSRFDSITPIIKAEIKRKALLGLRLEIETPLKLELYKLYQKENH
jgi:hypothetical protein